LTDRSIIQEEADGRQETTFLTGFRNKGIVRFKDGSYHIMVQDSETKLSLIVFFPEKN